jgi:transposase
MPCRLGREEVVTLHVLARKGKTNSEIARVLGVTEGAVRYHRRRLASGAVDGRSHKPRRGDRVGEVIRAWMDARKDARRPPNVEELYDHLVSEHDYTGSYKSVLRWVRAHYPTPRIRTYRRVETPPGAQTQTDWGEFPRVVIGGQEERRNAFVMALSHSRMPAIVWSRRQDQVCWLHCHNGAFRRLDGVAAVNRIDNVKTAIVKGAGAWGTIHPTYRSYARAVGFHVDACAPRQPQAKGKTEAKVRLSRLLVDVEHRAFADDDELQAWTDTRVRRWAKRSICPVTGKTVWESWQRELESLAPLPILPEPFDVAVTRPVHRDCMVWFENRCYPVPFQHVGEMVEVRGCADSVQILAEGRIVREYPRHTEERVLIDPRCYEGEATDRVLASPPLGKMGRRLQKLAAIPVERRPLDLYQALSEVARCAPARRGASMSTRRDRSSNSSGWYTRRQDCRSSSRKRSSRSSRRTASATGCSAAATSSTSTGAPTTCWTWSAYSSRRRSWPPQGV